jgi:hypothetical protein
MLKSPPAPPPAEISQPGFRNEAGRTTAHANVRNFRKTKYISAKTKIYEGSIFIGIMLGVVWAVGLLFTFKNGGAVVGYTAVFGGIFLAVVISIAIIRRANYTGKCDE